MYLSLYVNTSLPCPWAFISCLPSNKRVFSPSVLSLMCFPTPACLSAYFPPREVLSSFKFLLLLKVPETLLTYGAKQRNWVLVTKSFRCCCLQLVEIEATGSLPGAQSRYPPCLRKNCGGSVHDSFQEEEPGPFLGGYCAALSCKGVRISTRQSRAPGAEG